MSNQKEKQIEEISQLIFERSSESSFHPINRYFLDPYLEQITSLDPKDFLLYNLERYSSLYVQYLMLSLPELFEDFSLDDIISLIERVKKATSFFTIIRFTFKFVEVDIIPVIFNLPSIDIEVKRDILSFIKNQYHTFQKTETDLFFFENDAIGVSLDRWIYIKQKLLLDPRLLPAISSSDEFGKYLNLIPDA